MQAFMKQGDYVYIHGACHDTVAEIIDIRKPSEMPQIGEGAPDVAEVRAILAERDVQRVGFFGYYLEDKGDVAFIAFELPDGTWRDLQDQVLTVTPVERAKG